MKRAARIALVIGVIVVLGVTAPRAEAQQGVERVFAPGGRVTMALSAGGYTIRAGRDDRIAVTWQTRSAEDLKRVQVDLKTDGASARLMTRGPRNNFQVVIEVPPRTDLDVQLTAGDLRIEAVSGSKKVGSWAGDIEIDVGRPEDYASVHASVTAGDLSARPFEVTKGGLFRSFSWTGPGTYTLDVRLTAGDLTLR